jgi:tetrahydromethanopterin S-methyltransferase subunit A
MGAEQEGSVQPSPPGSPAPFSPTNRGTQKLPADGTDDGDEAEEQVEEQAAAEPGVVMEQHVMLSNADQREEEKKQNDLRRVRAEERVVENERPCVFKSISPVRRSFGCYSNLVAM